MEKQFLGPALKKVDFYQVGERGLMTWVFSYDDGSQFETHDPKIAEQHMRKHRLLIVKRNAEGSQHV